MIFDLSDTSQLRAFTAERGRQALRYGSTYTLIISPRQVLLIEPWDYREARR